MNTCPFQVHMAVGHMAVGTKFKVEVFAIRGRCCEVSGAPDPIKLNVSMNSLKDWDVMANLMLLQWPRKKIGKMIFF